MKVQLHHLLDLLVMISRAGSIDETSVLYTDASFESYLNNFTLLETTVNQSLLLLLDSSMYEGEIFELVLKKMIKFHTVYKEEKRTKEYLKKH